MYDLLKPNIEAIEYNNTGIRVDIKTTSGLSQDSTNLTWAKEASFNAYNNKAWSLMDNPKVLFSNRNQTFPYCFLHLYGFCSA